MAVNNLKPLKLGNLKPCEGAVKKRTRVGIGPGSGKGKTCGRGMKGQKSRSGGASRLGFEGGQMPLIRRVPKRGFTNIFKKEYEILNVEDLEVFEANSEIGPGILMKKGLIGKKIKAGVKVLGKGNLTKPLTVKAGIFSAGARKKIESAGGKVITDY